MGARRRILLVLRISAGMAFGLALLWLAFRQVESRELLRHLRAFPWLLLAPVVALVLLSSVVRAYRWKLLFLEAPPSTARLFLVENTGIGFNSVAPIRVLAEPTQFGYLVLRDGRDGGAVLASLVLVRVVDLTVTLAMIALGFLAFPPGGPVAAWVWRGMGLLAAVGLAVSALSLVVPQWLARWPMLATYGEAWRGLLTQPRRLSWILLVTAAQWLLLGLAAWTIAREVGIGLPFPVVHILTLAIMTLGLTLPGLPSGLGPFEFAAILLLSLYRVAAEQALAFGLIVHGAFLLPPILIAAFTLIAFGPPWRTAPERRAPATMQTPVAPSDGEGAGSR